MTAENLNIYWVIEKKNFFLDYFLNLFIIEMNKIEIFFENNISFLI